ncbi:MAG: VIT domain-containing protein [Phycisphaerales bacterium]
MNDGTNDNLNRITPGTDAAGGAPQSAPELEALLRQWHAQNAARAAAGRDRLLAALRAGSDAAPGVSSASSDALCDAGAGAPAPGRMTLPSLMEEIEGRAPRSVSDHTVMPHPPHDRRGTANRSVLRRIFMNRYSPLAAAVLSLASVMAYFVSISGPSGLNGSRPGDGAGDIRLAVDSENLRLIKQACEDRYVMAPDGGRLDAIDGLGNVLGPCILKHTDVSVQVSGFLSRVNVKQIYLNPHSAKVETVYTFPLSERAAVDRMTMTIGNRVIEGQVKERAEAQRIYQEAKALGRVASLLEQERPNIFTQSIANIEPQAEVAIEISYVEVLSPRDGVYSFTFPTTISPRYIPGEMRTWEASPPRPRPELPELPPGFRPRRGITLIGPASVVEMTAGDTSHSTLLATDLARELVRAKPVFPIPPTRATVWYNFVVRYDDGSRETGTLYTSGAGSVNNRWFYSPELARRAGNPWPPAPIVEQPIPDGHPGAAPTTAVPDADRITPMPVRPDQRAGHDISITVSIDPGGPGVYDVSSGSHTIATQSAGEFLRPPAGDDGAGRGVPRVAVRLAGERDIPNRDFNLTWKVTSSIDQPIVLTHTGSKEQGNFFFVSLLPPARAEDSLAVPREIMFVLDRSGSMKGFKFEQAKALIDATLATMRATDTFNVLCFSNNFETLWPTPRRATPENLAEARAFYNREGAGGGTEMLKVIGAALSPGVGPGQPTPPPPPPIQVISPENLANLPADGRDVIVDVPRGRLDNLDDQGNDRLPNRLIRMNGMPDLKVRIRNRLFAIIAPSIRLAGSWVTENGERILSVTQVDAGGNVDGAPRAVIEPAPVKPIRIVAFITDGEIGNDMQVLDAIRQHRGDARVFSFAVGDSPNRYLLDGMARLGRGEVEYVPLNSDPAQVIKRFAQRVSTPVLTDIAAQFSPNLRPLVQPGDTYTALGGGGGAGERVSDFEFIPDLYDQKPVIIVGRYTAPGSGTLTLSGNTASGPWSRTVTLDLPESQPQNNTIATLWARTKVESIMDLNLTRAQQGTIAADQRGQIVSIGESFNLVTQYTSFVAVDRLRVTIGGRSRLVQIPIEFEHGAEWSGYFGGPPLRRDYDDAYLEGGAGMDGVDQNGASRFGSSLNYVPGNWVGTDIASAAPGSKDAPRLRVAFAFDEVPQIDVEALLKSEVSARALQPVLGDAAVGFDPTVAVVPGLTRLDAGTNVFYIAPQPLSNAAVTDYSMMSALRREDMLVNSANTQPTSGVPAERSRAYAQLGEAVREKQRSVRTPGAPADAGGAPAAGAPGAAATPASKPDASKQSSDHFDFRGRGARREEPRQGVVQSPTPPPASEPAPAKSAPPPAPSGGGAGGPAPASPADRNSTIAEKKDAAPAEKETPSERSPRDSAGAKRPADANEASPETGQSNRQDKLNPAVDLGRPVNETAPAGNTPAAVADAQPISPAEQLGRFIETAQRATDPAERFSRVTIEPAGDQALIDRYLNDLDDQARSAVAALEQAIAQSDAAATFDQAIDAAPTGVPPDAGDKPADPARTSHDAAKTASATPAESASLPPAPVVRPVRREEVAMHVASLAKRHRLDDARTWAATFAQVAPDYDIATKMLAVLNDESFKDSHREAAVVMLGEQAAHQLAALVREARIRAVVEESLVPFALGQGYPDVLGRLFDGPFPEHGVMIEGGLAVSLVVRDTEVDTLKKLGEAGLRVESHDAAARVVVGVIPLGRLDDLALVPAVRKVEMMRE